MESKKLFSATNNPYYNGHEAVHQFLDEESGLNAIIAIHSTAMGPAMGGARVVEFSSELDGDIDSALSNALRLSEGMSYKNAAAGLPIGGGKAVVILAAGQKKTPELMRAFGRAIESLKGKYITAEDMGVNEQDMSYVAEETSYVAGLHVDAGVVGGNPSPYTAQGVFLSMKEAAKHKFGSADLTGRVVAVQGAAGNVGGSLSVLLHEAGAKVVASDTSIDGLKALKEKIPTLEVVGLGEIHKVEADIYAPCAIGGVLNDATIPEIKASIVVGAANNQLASPLKHAQALQDRGILYVPDFIANAGGIICCVSEYLNGKGQANITTGDLESSIQQIGSRTSDILEVAQAPGKLTNDVAISLAQGVISANSHAGFVSARG